MINSRLRSGRYGIGMIAAAILLAVGTALGIAPLAHAGGVIDNSCGEQVDPGSAGDQKWITDTVSFPDGTAYLYSGQISETEMVAWVYLQGSATEFGLDWSDWNQNPVAGANWHFCWNGPNGGWPATYAVVWAPLGSRCARAAVLDRGVWYHTPWYPIGYCA
jgi:hypothetical protein